MNPDVRGRKSEVTTPALWKSLATRDLTATQRAALQVEFEQRADVAHWDPIDRRDFVRLMGASMAMAGLVGCTKQPEEKIVPYVSQPEEIVPGKPLYFATTMTLGGYGYGVLAESHEGRPTKIEGNPEHTASLGRTDVFGQASILNLYDPDRSQTLLQRGRASSWDAFLTELNEALALQMGKQGAGIRVLTETVTSPTLAGQVKAILAAYPRAKWHQYEPVNRDNAKAGAKLAFGEMVDTVYQFDKADVIVALDSDFLTTEPGHLRYAAEFAARRNVAMGAKLNRLYAFETMYTITGASADHRWAMSPRQVEAAARALAKAVGVDAAPSNVEVPHDAIAAVAEDLQHARGRSVVIAGEGQPAVVHALAHAMNEALGNVGQTVTYIEPAEAQPVLQNDSIRDLAKDLEAGAVDILVVLGGNPAYYAPADLNMAKLLEKPKLLVHLGLYLDETGKLAHWHIPEAHFLEAWGDARAFDGTASIVQPLILPLYGGRSAIEIAAAVAGNGGKSGYDLVREAWQQLKLGPDFEKAWRRSVHDGFVAGSAKAARTVAVKAGVGAASEPAAGDVFEVVFRADSSIWDGRFANNGWLQECPRPISKVVWDNALMISPATAKMWNLPMERRGESTQPGRLADVKVGGRTLKVPVWVVPGHADNAGTLHLGYGRTGAGRVGNGVGFNTYALRGSDAPWAAQADVVATAEAYDVVTTQEHHTMAGRHMYRQATREEFEKTPDFALHHDEFGGQTPPSLYPGFDYTKGHQWGMVIDLSTCIGCNACVVACQAENNIPVVGREQVRKNREMHWIRVDRYFAGSAEAPTSHFQPLPCMHCENAPCENVCPVAATVHSNEGINQMVYNRCVGTRYCSNNCPYKVRRFNFLKYADDSTPSLKLMRNPDVTVRARGVMEKCTYCIQRISEARIPAKRENRAIRDGEVVAACQQACPAGAIIFGNINDPESAIAKRRASPLNYGMLTELNTRPRTTYLARVINPNPALHAGAPVEHKEHA
jgi:Fe-S-cluster-containing dehydrogenase component/anaerobic selenocysteine-containing dehydrogenase